MSEQDSRGIDPSSRRGRLGAFGAAALVLAASVTIAACGGDGGLEGGKREQAGTVATGSVAKELNFSNWPLYIDVDEKTKRRGTLDEFKREHGTTVKYTEDINDNVEFFGKLRQQLAAGKSGGRDMFVVTGWMADKMANLGYLQKLDKSQLPTVEKNLLDSLRKPATDPNREYTVPWQSGMTGLVVRTDKAPDVKSIADVFDPKYKGKVTMLTEMRDTVPMVMLTQGKNPETASTDEWLAAIDKIEKANDSGQIRKFTGNDYTKDLTKGDAWISFGWSGDAVQLEQDNPKIKFIPPTEGVMLWTDNMVVPVGAKNGFTAQKLMDFVYQPEVQADIAEYVNYVTPVKGVKQLLEDRDLANNPLIFPPKSLLDKGHDTRSLKEDEEREINEAFEKLIGA